MRVGERVLGVLRDRLVEVDVLFLGDFVLAARPDGLDVVDGLPLPDLLGDRLHFDFLLLVASLFFAFISNLELVAVD